jgi:hypothetical protein
MNIEGEYAMAQSLNKFLLERLEKFKWPENLRIFRMFPVEDVTIEENGHLLLIMDNRNVLDLNTVTKVLWLLNEVASRPWGKYYKGEEDRIVRVSVDRTFYLLGTLDCRKMPMAISLLQMSVPWLQKVLSTLEGSPGGDQIKLILPYEGRSEPNERDLAPEEREDWIPQDLIKLVKGILYLKIALQLLLSE